MTYSLSDFQKKIQAFDKVDLIHSPTPIQKLENLTEELGGPEIYMKRDDLTGLAFGGNKSRKLEFIIPDVLEKGADVIITWASLQSNWCLQTAAAARRFGITPLLVLFKTYELPEEFDGNLLLDYILEADIKIKEAEWGKVVSLEDVDEVLKEVKFEVEEGGHTPYVAPIGGSMVWGSMKEPLGAISYAQAFAEMIEQTETLGFQPDFVVHASGSGGTQAGLVVGAKALTPDTKVLGISVSEEKDPFSRDVYTIAQETEQALDVDIALNKEADIHVLDEYLGEGYGIVTRDVSETIRQVSVKEGIFLDPVYTGKAMTGLFDLVKKGTIKKEDKVVFFHTGGTAALFPNKHKLTSYLK
jgi:D-cysteine desulfhydrase family pyridoxal phosphate-dependent enzyme